MIQNFNTSQLIGSTGNIFRAVVNAHTQELDLNAWCRVRGWNGIRPVSVEIMQGIYVWSDNTAVAGLTVSGFTNGIEIINNGFIMGKGGEGGSYYSQVGKAGGSGISITTTVNLNTGTGYIAGGGGGGSGQTSGGDDGDRGGGGGGAGGGLGGSTSDNPGRFAAGGAGGLIGAYGATGGSPWAGWGGAGGYGAGSGGSFKHDSKGPDLHGAGGGGGRILNTTVPYDGATGSGVRGGGGGWGRAGLSVQTSGGAAGSAITKNGSLLTIVGSQSLIYGSIV